MAVNIDTRCVDCDGAVELYISATPKGTAPAEAQAVQMFSGIREVLQSKGAHILQERVFGTAGAMNVLSEARRKAYGPADDGVAPSYLVGREAMSGPVCGVQVHAISGVRPETVRLDGVPCGRVYRGPSRAYLTLSAISCGQSSDRTGQARVMLEKAESALRQFGGDFKCVPRTWMWLGDILSWYGDFNKVRNQFFIERGIIGAGSRQSMPASTGIGLTLAGDGQCGMDLTAVLEPHDSITFLAVIGKQQCALDYGSAFSRASRAITPAGSTVFVSGTASIDAGGATTNIGNVDGQIEATLENVRAVLKDMKCSDDDVVQAVAYCKSIDVENAFSRFKKRLDWPWVSVICDICRDELLFEIEATAMPRK